jgi:hypothetical protein
MVSVKKIKDPEFLGWHEVSNLRKHPTLWRYVSPDNAQYALVNTATGDVMFIMDAATGDQLYMNPNTPMQARFEMAVKKLI